MRGKRIKQYKKELLARIALRAEETAKAQADTKDSRRRKTTEPDKAARQHKANTRRSRSG